MTPVDQRWRGRAGGSQANVEHESRRQESRAAHEKWRQGFDRETNAEVGRTPDQIDRGERGDNQAARRIARTFSRCAHVTLWCWLRRVRSEPMRRGGKTKNPPASQRWVIQIRRGVLTCP